ncbi:MAG: hypothetical protein DMD91_01900 [Candidatus Rokuibacteriota bacterium]|nr:MAG: hypothetical protein DMD91_01900 [Candidatus Rokubacteria bacterium]
MAGMRWTGLLVAVMLATSACALLPTPVPERAYFPDTTDPRTRLLSETLYRAAAAAGDDPTRYSFAMIQTGKVAAVTHEEGIFYFSEGLAAQTPACVDAFVAHEVAHEVLGHVGKRRALSLGVSGGFTVIGFIVPGLGLMDFLVNPVIVRAFTRDQSLDADQKTLEILRAMGHEAPRRTLTDALKAAASLNGPSEGIFLLTTEPDLDDRLAALEPLETEPTGLARNIPPKR